MDSRSPVAVKRWPGPRSRSAGRACSAPTLNQPDGKIRASIGGGLKGFVVIPRAVQDSGSLLRIQHETARGESNANSSAPTGIAIDFDFETGRTHRLKY